jgi:uncharacterized membrane-anchored protein YjiN (DUF445 family)
MDAERIEVAIREPPRRSQVGNVSLLAALVGALACQAALLSDTFAEAAWLRLAAAGFDAALVGALADWFAVTALFRHPLGIPIPHTAILPKRRAKIVEGIVTMIERQWLSPAVIRTRLAGFEPSVFVVDWLRDPDHGERIAGPVRDLLRSAARVLSDEELVAFVDRTVQRQLRQMPIDTASGRWLQSFLGSERAAKAFAGFAESIANVAQRPDAAANVRAWLDRAAQTLRRDGRRLVPLILRRGIVQRAIVDATCDYASVEMRKAAVEVNHPFRQAVFNILRGFADRLASGDPEMLVQLEQLRQALVESLAARPMIADVLTQVRAQVERELATPEGTLSRLVARQLRTGIIDALDDPHRRATFDQWVRATADDLIQRHHHQIGRTVRENLEALETSELIAQIEDRVGADLQYIRLNGALVGGLIGVVLAIAHRLIG